MHDHSKTQHKSFNYTSDLDIPGQLAAMTRARFSYLTYSK